MAKSETVTLLKSLDHRVGDLNHRVGDLDHRVGDLNHRVGDLDHRVGNLDDRLRILDHRVAGIEQILPTLATKDDLKDFPTAKDPKGFATKEDLREEGERSRRYMKMLSENILDRVNSALDGQIGHTRRLDEHETRLDGHDAAIGAIDLRVTAIERPGGRRG